MVTIPRKVEHSEEIGTLPIVVKNLGIGGAARVRSIDFSAEYENIIIVPFYVQNASDSIFFSFHYTQFIS